MLARAVLHPPASVCFAHEQVEEWKAIKVPAGAKRATEAQKAEVKAKCKAQAVYFGWQDGPGPVQPVFTVGRGVEVKPEPLGMPKGDGEGKTIVAHTSSRD